MERDIIVKLKDCNLLGRGGALFPTWIKWEAVKKQEGKKIYIVANGSEGEPAVFKDEYILKTYPAEFIGGIKIALDTFANSEAIIYLNHFYYDLYEKNLEKLIAGYPITFFRKTARYIAGDETALMSHIEGKRDEPRIKPPYPAESGLWGNPTLINNIETFYRIYQINNNVYQNKAFFSVSGAVPKPGVYEFDQNEKVIDVLAKSGNLPKEDFFVQLGGGAAGGIFLKDELKKPIAGAAAIKVFSAKTDPFTILEYWANFYAAENCDKCTPCREGSIRILEMVKKRHLDYEKLDQIFFAMEKTAFCPLGRGMSTPYKTLIEKVIKK